MRYLIILEEYQYNDFQKVDGNPLEIYARDATGIKRIFDVRPIQREMLVMPNGASAYLTQGHIEAMMVYEREQHIKEICDRMKHNLDGINDVDLPKHVPLVTAEEPRKQSERYCFDCKYSNRAAHMWPCCHCSHNCSDHWAKKD